MTKIFNFRHTCKINVKVLTIVFLTVLCCLDEGVYANSLRSLSNSENEESSVGNANILSSDVIPSEADLLPDQDDDEEPNDADESPPDKCWGLEFSEVYTYYTTGENKNDQYIEIFNTTDTEIDLTGCTVEYYILYSNQQSDDEDLGTLKTTIPLNGKIGGEGYLAWFANNEHSLTKDPSGVVTLRLLNDAGDEVDRYTYNDQKEGRAWAWFGVTETGQEDWRLTYALTPNAANQIQDCADPEKILNPETGRCINPPEEDEEPEMENSNLPSQCEGLVFSEIFTYYEDSVDEQFVELYNSSSEWIQLDGCSIQYKSKKIELSGGIAADEYLARYVPEVSLTKNPSKSNELKLVDVNGQTRDTLIYYHGQKKGVAYAQFDFLWTGEENWQHTYAPTPGEPNVYQKYKTCPEGKVINEETGNCVKISSSTVLEPCPPGKYRNPLTNRCKSVFAASSELKPCPEGYERNPETNRCRKIVSNTGADYGFSITATEGDNNFIAFGALGAVGVMGVCYVTWQFRREITAIGKKVADKIKRSKPTSPT